MSGNAKQILPVSLALLITQTKPNGYSYEGSKNLEDIHLRQFYRIV